MFNRGFWQGGYYLGEKLGEWSNHHGSKATTKKVQLGYVKNYFEQAKVGHFLLEANEVTVGDEILIIGPTTGVVKAKVENIVINGKKVDSAKAGDEITIPIKEKIRPNDKLYKIVPRN